MNSLATRFLLEGESRAYGFPKVRAWWDASRRETIVADAASRVSRWKSLRAPASALTQATGAAQPLLLDSAAGAFLYVPGVTGNTATTPDSAALAITSLDFAIHVSADDWTPAGSNHVIAGQVTSFSATGMAWYLQINNATGLLTLVHADGTSTYIDSSSVAPSVADGARIWLRVTMRPNVAGSREVVFYTAPDAPSRPSSWSQLGTTVTGAASAGLHNSTAAFTIGGAVGFSEVFLGRILSAELAAYGGAVIARFAATEASHNATSWVSSTGETWTVNQSGGVPAQIVGVGKTSLLFDGSSDFMRAAAFPLNQPAAVYFVGKQITNTASDYIYDGAVTNTIALMQNGGTAIRARAPAQIANDVFPSLQARAIITSVFNGPASSNRLNLGTPNTGDIGSSSGAGFELGATNGGSTGWANIEVHEIVIYAAAHAPTQQAAIVAKLAAKWGISV